MPETIPENFLDLFTKPVQANLVTLMPGGQPQITVVWCDYDGIHVIFNSAKGRQKERNLRRDPRVALSLVDPQNPYRYLEVRGKVIEITEQGADAHADRLAKKYLGVDKYPYRQPGEVRLIFKIEPQRVRTQG